MLMIRSDQIRAKKGVPKYNREQIWIDFMEEVNFIGSIIFCVG